MNEWRWIINFISACILLHAVVVESFVLPSTGGPISRHAVLSTLNLSPKESGTHNEEVGRRGFLNDSFAKTIAIIAALTVPVTFQVGGVAHAAMENSQKVFEVGKDLTPAQAKARFKEGQKSLNYLLEHYDEICEGGGDNIRRYLGTVGTTSGLYGISKVMRTLQDEADDIVEYTETMNEVNAALQGADGSAYMAIFTVTSTSGVPPEKYFGDAKIEIKRAIRSMQEIATQLDI